MCFGSRESSKSDLIVSGLITDTLWIWCTTINLKWFSLPHTVYKKLENLKNMKIVSEKKAWMFS